MIISVRETKPQWGEDCFIAPNATLIGDLVMGNQCSVWFGSVLRADVNSIRIGNNVNLQDGCIVHCTYKKTKTIIEDNVSIGHRAIIHGCYIQSNVLIGMGAIIMDKACIEANVIVAAGAVVKQNSKLEKNWIYGGIPAKKIKPLDAMGIKSIKDTATNYIKYAKWYQ